MALTDELGALALAVGGLGTAAYGVVDGLKSIEWVNLAGFENLFSDEGNVGGRSWIGSSAIALNPLLLPLQRAYGDKVMALLRAQYQGGRGGGELPVTLRQGVRIGFGVMSQEEVAATAIAIGIPEATAKLAAAALAAEIAMSAAKSADTAARPPDEANAALARLQTAIDARIDAALALAESYYVAQTKLLAMVVSLIIACIVGRYFGQGWVVCFMVGLMAVPLAPVAKDLSTALQEAVKIFKRK